MADESSLDDFVDLLRKSDTGDYDGVLAHAVKSLKSSEDMRKFYRVLVDLTGDNLRRAIERGSDLSLEASLVAMGTPIEDVARGLARSQLVEVLSVYHLGGAENVPKEWSSAVPELKIPERYLS